MNQSQSNDKHYLVITGYCREHSNDMNIIDGIILIIYKYQKSAKWSRQKKGELISLSDDDSKAICTKDVSTDSMPGSICADFSIDRGEIISWELECMIICFCCNFFGVISSKVIDFQTNPADGMKDAYGIDDDADRIYDGNGGTIITDWRKPDFPIDEVFTIEITADWTEKQCKLTFFYNGKKLNEEIDDYTMLLPEFDDDVVLYPCVRPYNKDSYCIIRYA